MRRSLFSINACCPSATSSWHDLIGNLQFHSGLHLAGLHQEVHQTQTETPGANDRPQNDANCANYGRPPRQTTLLISSERTQKIGNLDSTIQVLTLKITFCYTNVPGLIFSASSRDLLYPANPNAMMIKVTQSEFR